MAEYTETYENVLKRWAAKAGIQYDDLLSTESDLFQQYAQERLRYIWNYTDWPETVNVCSEVLADQTFTADTTIAYIFGIFELHPYETTSTDYDSYRYRRLQDEVYVYGNDVPASVYVLYKERTPDFATSTDTVPRRFSEYIAQGAYSDYLKTEGDPRADREEQKAEFYLQRELELYERQEQQSGWLNGNKVYRPPVQ